MVLTTFHCLSTFLFCVMQHMENHAAIAGEDPGFGLHEHQLSHLKGKRMMPELTQLSNVVVVEAAALSSYQWCCSQTHSLSRMFYTLYLILSIDSNEHLNT